MKKALLYLALPVLFCLSSFENLNETQYTKSQTETFIKEVFADQAKTLVLNSPDRLALIEGFLSRVAISNSPEYAGKKFNLLSTIGLQNKYNPNLTRDININPATFNPLKYRLPMTSRKTEIFRIDRTDYLIIIQPVK